MKACPHCAAENHDKAAVCKGCDRPFPGITLQPFKPDRSGTIMLVVVAVLFGVGGLVFASQATGGVAAIALGCLFAILARISQAGRHHEESMRARANLSPFERHQP
ncbi:MAG TPA: hypothetical protein VM756_09945 [Burkholderiales bacterium]|nr:hypothetical protein [Burkholderiales bacterium]